MIHIHTITNTHSKHTHTHSIQSTHRQTHTSAKFSRKGEGFVSNNGRNRFSTPQVSQINTQVVPLPNNQADSSFLHRVPPVRGRGGGGGGGCNDSYQLNQHDDDNKGNVMHTNRLRKSAWQTKENSVNSAFGEGTRRCFSFVNSNGLTQTGRRRSTLNHDGGWTISTSSVSLPTIFGWSRSR